MNTAVQIAPWEDRIRQAYLVANAAVSSLKKGERADPETVLELLELTARDIEAHCWLNPDRTGGPILEMLIGNPPSGWLSESIEWVRDEIEKRNERLGFEPES